MISKILHFDVSAGLKRVLGRELITDDEVAIFELVKNSFDAGADKVHLYFGEDIVLIADNGSGMTYDDLTDKWLFVAYSAKREGSSDDFRDRIADRSHYAGSKGIGRFSSDRIGESLTLQTRPESDPNGLVHLLSIDWSKFDADAKSHFEKIPIQYYEEPAFSFPEALGAFGKGFSHGTVIEIGQLNLRWTRAELQHLKASLAKLINPFGSDVDQFQIEICAPAEEAEDERIRADAARKGERPITRNIVNGRVGNFIFSDLQERTTFIDVKIEGTTILTSLTDRGELIYQIKEPSPYPQLADSGLHAEVYYLNHSAKITFARRVGLPSVQFGSVFLFRNGFRVYPIGEDGDDWFGIARRKQQGYSRFLGTREVIGRVDVFGTDADFQESSSRNTGLIETVAVQQLKRCVMDHCIRRLEKYVVPVSWVDKADADASDLSRLLTEPGRARVSAAVAGLVDNDDIELLDYSRKLIDLLNERSNEFEQSLVSLRTIAEKAQDNELTKRIDQAERRFEELKKAEAEARRVADQERKAAEEAAARAQRAEEEVSVAKAEVEVERRRASFLEAAINIDTKTILGMHHQVTLYSVDVQQQIENLIAGTQGQETIPRDTVLRALEQMAFLNSKIHSTARLAAQANFQLDSAKVETDLACFIEDYITNIARRFAGTRLKIAVTNSHPGWESRFDPIDVSVIIDNFVSNAKRARASQISFDVSPLEKSGLQIRIKDNGKGIAKEVDPGQIFEMGYTTTSGSGLGLYHVRQVLGDMNGSVELVDSSGGAEFLLKLMQPRKAK